MAPIDIIVATALAFARQAQQRAARAQRFERLMRMQRAGIRAGIVA